MIFIMENNPLIFITENNPCNYDLDAIRQHAEWISKQQVERLRDEDLIFAIEWFDYNQKFVMEQKRRGIIRKFIESLSQRTDSVIPSWRRLRSCFRSCLTR